MTHNSTNALSCRGLPNDFGEGSSIGSQKERSSAIHFLVHRGLLLEGGPKAINSKVHNLECIMRKEVEHNDAFSSWVSSVLLKSHLPFLFALFFFIKNLFFNIQSLGNLS